MNIKDRTVLYCADCSIHISPNFQTMFSIKSKIQSTYGCFFSEELYINTIDIVSVEGRACPLGLSYSKLNHLLLPGCIFLKTINLSFFFFKFYFIFKLYNIVLVLPNIEMNLSQVYMCSPS